MQKNRKTSDPDFNKKVAGILGLGLQDSSGDHRVSSGAFFHLMEGTEAGHEAMLELCLHIERSLSEQGRGARRAYETRFDRDYSVDG